jgi:polysaccharide deacetylase family protein (PEP-CTERM system associated)
MNILSFDLEDWYQLATRRITGALPPTRDTIFRQVDALLTILAENSNKATFFVLGLVAERYPELIRELAAAGHEIASHGYAHVVLSRLSQAEFEEDVAKSKALLERITGEEVTGYRAPEFSIGRDTAWAMDSLAKLGFTYDSSIFPIRHPRYGIPDFDPYPRVYTTGSGDIIELPLSAVRLAGTKLPVAGGGYFRVLPLDLLRRSVRWLDHRGLPFVTYFHPYEFDPEYLDVLQTVTPISFGQHLRCRKLNLRYRVGHHAVGRKLAALLKEFQFSTCKEYLNAVELTKGRTLLRPISVAV